MRDDFGAIEAGFGLAGSYRLESILGEGGMGTVYRAVQLSLDRPVAVKVMKRSPGWEGELERRFLAEAQLAARISHPNVVRVLGSGSGEAGLYIVYELIEGSSLSQILEQPLEPSQALDYALQALDGLEAIHEAGAIHRDLKPENMLVDRQGRLKLADLGIAKDLTGAGGRTRTGVLVGTPAYMSPEQCRGRAVGPASDVYSMGVVVYAMLTGVLPFRSVNPLELLDLHVQAEPPAPSSQLRSLPASWDRPLLKALAKTPEQRYGSAAEFARALRGLSRKPSPPAPTKLSSKPPPAKPGAKWPAAVALAVIALVSIGIWLRPRKSPPPVAAPLEGNAVAGIASALAAERRVKAQVMLHPLQELAGPGLQAYACEVLLVGASSILAPRLEAQWARDDSWAGELPAPRLFLETSPGRKQQESLLASEAGPREKCVAAVPAGQLRDGMNRFRLELPKSRASLNPAVALSFDRARVFADPATEAPPPECADCCPPGVGWAMERDHLNIEQVAKMLELDRTTLKQWPGCAPLGVEIATSLFWVATWRRKPEVTGLRLLDQMPDLPAEARRPEWRLLWEAYDLLDDAIRSHPGWGLPWFRYMSYSRQLLGLDVSLRAARQALLLRPRDARIWKHLAEVELALARQGDAAGLEAALSHVNHALRLFESPSRRALAFCVRGQILMQMDRDEEARADFQEARSVPAAAGEANKGLAQLQKKLLTPPSPRRPAPSAP